MAQSSHVKPLVRGPTDLVQSHESTNFGTLNHTFIFWRIQLYIYICVYQYLNWEPNHSYPMPSWSKRFRQKLQGERPGLVEILKATSGMVPSGATDVQKWPRFADLFVRGSDILRQTFFLCVCGLNTCMLMSVYIYIYTYQQHE